LNKGKAASSVEEMRAQLIPDPTIVCTAFKKRRLYLFSRRMPVCDCDDIVILAREIIRHQSLKYCLLWVDYQDDVSTDVGGRDIFNERPTAEETKVS